MFYGKPSSIVIFSVALHSYHLVWRSCCLCVCVCLFFFFTTQQCFRCFCHRSFTNPGQSLHQFLSFKIPTRCGNCDFVLQPWQSQTWLLWRLFSLSEPQAESSLLLTRASEQSPSSAPFTTGMPFPRSRAWAGFSSCSSSFRDPRPCLLSFSGYLNPSP